MIQIPQSTSRVVTAKMFLAGTNTPATGKTVAVTLSKNGATSFSNPNAGATIAAEMAAGWYKFTADATDTNTLGDLICHFTNADCDDSDRLLGVVSATTGGLTALPDAAPGASNGLWILGTNAARPTLADGLNLESLGGPIVNMTGAATGGAAHGINIGVTGTGAHPIRLIATGVGGNAIHATSSGGGVLGYGMYLSGFTDDIYLQNSDAPTLSAAVLMTDGISAASVSAAAVAKIQNGLAPSATALSTETWTSALATNLGTTNTTVATNLDAAVSSRATPAQVNAEVLDVVTVDTFAEPTGAPAATATLAEKIGRNYQALRNRVTVTANSKTFYSDAGAALWSKALSDDGTTYTEAEGA